MGLVPSLFFWGAYVDQSYNYSYQYANSFDFDVCVKILLANGLKEKIENLL